MGNISLRKDNSFNAIRLICCLIIIIGHSMDLSETGHYWVFIRKYLIQLNDCVNVFFILSGFFVTRSYLAKKSNGMTVGKFYRHRAYRLLPSYYITIVLSTIGFFGILHQLYNCDAQAYLGTIHFWKYLFSSISTLNFICPSPVSDSYANGAFAGFSLNGSLWTMKIEIGFYIFLPLLIFCLEKLNTKKSRNLFLTVLYILSVFWKYSLKYLGIKTSSGIFFSLSDQLPGYAAYFISGILIVYNWKFINNNLNKLVIPAIALYMMHFAAKTEILVPLTLSICVFWVGLNFRQIGKIGGGEDYSYEMYLFHWPLIMYCVQGEMFAKLPALTIVMVIATSFLYAFIIHKLLRCIRKSKSQKNIDTI